VTDVKDLYHYTDSGLRNVYLKNGYSVKKTPYGRGVSIHDVAGLHQLLGMELVCNKAGKLSSTEIRFLRVEMDLPQVHLASLLGVSENTIRAWENNRGKITKPAELLLRTLYKQYADLDSDIRQAVEHLASLNRREGKLVFVESKKGWKTAA
jgi:putative transcriptional regulator